MEWPYYVVTLCSNGHRKDLTLDATKPGETRALEPCERCGAEEWQVIAHSASPFTLLSQIADYTTALRVQSIE